MKKREQRDERGWRQIMGKKKMATIRKKRKKHTHTKYANTNTHSAKTTDCRHIHTPPHTQCLLFQQPDNKDRDDFCLGKKNCQCGCSLGDLIGEEEDMRTTRGVKGRGGQGRKKGGK